METKEILFDQIKATNSNFSVEINEKKVSFLRAKNFPIEGINIEISNSGINLDFSNFSILQFETLKTFFADRFQKIEETALYQYDHKKGMTIFFRKRKAYDKIGKFEYAMWQYEVFKKILDSLNILGKSL
jgi:hypothetical protein